MRGKGQEGRALYSSAAKRLLDRVRRVRQARPNFQIGPTIDDSHANQRPSSKPGNPRLASDAAPSLAMGSHVSFHVSPFIGPLQLSPLEIAL